MRADCTGTGSQRTTFGIPVGLAVDGLAPTAAELLPVLYTVERVHRGRSPPEVWQCGRLISHTQTKHDRHELSAA